MSSVIIVCGRHCQTPILVVQSSLSVLVTCVKLMNCCCYIYVGCLVLLVISRYTVWLKKIPLPEIFWHFSQTVGIIFQILHTCYTFLSTLDYKFLFNYLQLWRSYAILSATTIMWSKCPPSNETHTGWLHLIWHNFVTVWDNWIKICILPYVCMFNRCVKFGQQIPNCLGKMSENASVHFGWLWTFCAHDVNWVVTLNMAQLR